MATILLELPPETEQKLRDRAARVGLTLETFLVKLAEKALQSVFVQEHLSSGEPKYLTRPLLTDEEFEQNMQDLASGPVGKSLPADFSRADIYDDHD